MRQMHDASLAQPFLQRVAVRGGRESVMADESLKWLPVPLGYVGKFGDVTDPESWFNTTMEEDSACDHCVRLLRNVNGHELHCFVHGPQWVARTLENALLWIEALQADLAAA